VIVTVTLNAALDRTLTVPNFQRGQRHRASQGLMLAGGKGINVARALKILDVPVGGVTRRVVLTAGKIVFALDADGQPTGDPLFVAGPHPGFDDIESLRDLASGAPVVRALNDLLERAVELRASDIHIEPFRTGLVVRMRVDGLLRAMPARRTMSATVTAR